ncbi:hypothetical protein U1Q18_006865 [Sarracenia purpurea var. burkii]
MKRKQEDDDVRSEIMEYQRKSTRKYGGDGMAWFRGAMIGKGSSGSVYLATSKKPRSRYGYFPEVMAVKSAEVSVSGLIQKERQVFSNIGRCPNVMECFGEEITTSESGQMVYNLLLEYGSGGTLGGLIKKSGGRGLPESDVRRYARTILRGLNHIHECGYVHCDLKLANILLVRRNSTGSPTEFAGKIGDFGLAKRAKQTRKNVKLDSYSYWRGTLMYLSPEAAADNIQDPPSDIWAFGCVVLEMLTGKPPYNQDQDFDVLLRQIGEGNESLKIPNDISREGKEFLKGCFERKSMYRFTAEMLLNHSFVEGLVDDDDDNNDDDGAAAEEEVEEVEGQESVGSTETIVSPVLDDVINTSKLVPTNTMQQCPMAFTIPAGV